MICFSLPAHLSAHLLARASRQAPGSEPLLDRAWRRETIAQSEREVFVKQREGKPCGKQKTGGRNCCQQNCRADRVESANQSVCDYRARQPARVDARVKERPDVCQRK